MIERTPTIISASRATDLPAFYAEWFFNRLEEGYLLWESPYNKQKYRISFENVRLIVFWSKNPAPLLPYLSILRKRRIGVLLHYTLNDYQKFCYEPGLPSVDERIETMGRFAEAVGKEKVIWRYDPLFMTEQLSLDQLFERVCSVAKRVNFFTQQLVFSFADPSQYSSVQRNLDRSGVVARAFLHKEKLWFVQQLLERNKEWQLKIASCAEDIVGAPSQIERAVCIDPRLLAELYSDDYLLMQYLGYTDGPDLFGEWPDIAESLKDKGQRKGCRCVQSKDVGAYNSCPHGCVYCYANYDPYQVMRNYQMHDPQSPSLCERGG